MISPEVLEPVAMRAFPATTEERLGGWVLRSDDQLPNRRVNSAWDLGEPELPTEEAISAVRAWYKSRGRRAILKTEPGSRADHEVAGWRVEAPTSVRVRDAETHSEPDVRFNSPDALDAWCTAFASIRGFDAQRATGLLTSYRRLERLALAVIEEHGSPIAVGMGVLDGTWIGLFDIATRPDRQRRGLAASVTNAIVGWGADRGASHTYLQVEDDNVAANTLYEGLGFARHYGYHYRIAP